MNRLQRILTATVIASQMACDSEQVVGPSADELIDTPLSAVVDGKDMVLSSTIFRSFAPGTPANGGPLTATLVVSFTDGSFVPTTLVLDSVWVVSGNHVWTTTTNAVFMENPPNTELKALVLDGPKWGPDIFVDVILRIVDTGGTPHRVRAANQVISRIN
jgi:hypothetical protein